MSYFKLIIRDASKSGASLNQKVREFIKRLPKTKHFNPYEEDKKNQSTANRD